MSGNYKNRDGFLYWPSKLDSIQEVLISATFDQQVDQDEYEIEELIKEEKVLRKVCIFKLFLFFPEYFFAKLIFGPETCHFKKEAGKLYWKFYRKQITIEEFKIQLTSVMNSGKIV